MDTLQNKLLNMHLGGAVGSVIAAHEANWLHAILTDDPGLFDGFADPDDAAVAKTMWHGEFPGKLLTGIAQTYLLNNDPETKRTGDAFVDNFKRVQQADGYLGPWSQDVRFEKDAAAGSWGKWDTWGQYHCICGLYRWYQVTGNRDALATAIRALDNVYTHFIDGGVSLAAQNWAECNLAIGHAFALLYEETGDSRYLAAAERIVNVDWNDEYPDFYTKTTLCCGWLNAALAGKAYYASGQPRWEGLYALETLAALYRITGTEKYLAALNALWQGMYEHDRHNTGSFGTGEGATGDLYGAGSETCNTVAWMAFSTEYLKISRAARVADELELSFFNATLGSLLAGERNFTYMNDSTGRREPARTVLAGHSYAGARDMSCCQANGSRGLSQFAEWAVLSADNALFLNYYGACALEIGLGSSQKFTLTQTTDYPRSGVVRIRVNTGRAAELTLNFRIPSWSETTRLSVNGEPVSHVCPGSYCAVTRVWRAGDNVELSLDMSPHFWVADAEHGAKLSVYSGPVLLAFRPVDGLPADTRFGIDALRGLIRADGDGLVGFRTVSAAGREVALTDYYTAGKYGDNYVSWLNCDYANAPLPSAQIGRPIWCAR